MFARLGRIEEARENFDRTLSYANDLGLFAEEIDPETGAFLGNFPQAFTHVGLINAALTLENPSDDSSGPPLTSGW
jgi:GH15 family glucan-1,4-alpha-glucosidase